MRTSGKSTVRPVLAALGLAAVVLAALALAAAGGFVLWLAQADLRPFVERQATAALDRRVSLGAIDIDWSHLWRGDPLSLEIRDLRVANAPWGSEPEMIRIGQFSAQIDVPALLTGVLRYERLRVADLQVVLERDPRGRGNWKFGDETGDESAGFGNGVALVPKNRTQFPTLIDFAGENARITYRTRGGNLLRIGLDQVAIAAPDKYSAVTLRATGAYNDVAAQLDATTDPYFILRDASVPFGARFSLIGDDTDIGFEGTLMEPLDFDGVRGKLSVIARSLDDLAAILGSQRKVDLPLLLVGAIVRDGDHWSLADARGRLLRAGFTGRLELLEGRVSGKTVAPDDLAVDLDFGPVDFDPILAAFAGGARGGESKGGMKWDSIPLRPNAPAGLNLTATLSSEEFSVAGLRFPDFALDGRLAGGAATLRDLKFVFGGGTLAFDGSLTGAGGQGDLRLNAHLIKARAEEIAGMLGGGEEIRGRLNGAATLRLRGATLGEGLKRSSGAALVTLAQGDIARSLVERVSADLRSLFRIEEGRVEVGCLLAAMTVKDGVGTLLPLRLESDAAILLGGGTVDLAGRRLDLTLKTERDSTGFFALDLPIRVSGPLDALSAEPDSEADRRWIEAAEMGVMPDGLPKGLRALAKGNACAG